MEKLKLFLRILNENGYPNPDVVDFAKMIDYDLDNFLSDLQKELGDDGVLDFCKKTINKISGEKGIKIDLDGLNEEEYCYIHIYPIFYDKDESENDIISRSIWGESHILSTNEEGEGEYMTIQEIIDHTDMGGWSELDELLDHIKEKAYNKVFANCGFGIWWQ